MLNKFIVSLVVGSSLLGITGCFSGDDAPIDESLSSENFSTYSDDAFIIQYPKNWKIKDTELDSDVKDTIEVAFISNFKDPFFTPVITVEKIAVAEGKTTAKFGDENISLNENLVSFEELERVDLPLVVGESAVLSKLIRFQAKQALGDDTLEFIQTYLVKGGLGYVITGAYDANDDDAEASKMIQTLKSFRLK